MSWQDRERERYEGMLAERWGVDGKRNPPSRVETCLTTPEWTGIHPNLIKGNAPSTMGVLSLNFERD